ncbi:hypothetical protein [Streptomyces ambofaciens]|uniref:hypothetical protein n=1 Tax=Streptomyces ambofaciens TaxID=1889 RepID=UPI001F469347|nr:hypothetical protein [Streptomyces ambofaciens]
MREADVRRTGGDAGCGEGRVPLGPGDLQRAGGWLGGHSHASVRDSDTGCRTLVAGEGALAVTRPVAHSSHKRYVRTADGAAGKVYANTAAELAERGRDGRYVMVELSADDEAAALWVTQQGSGGGVSASASSWSSPSPSASASSGTGESPGGGGPSVGDSTPGGTIVAAKATLVQKGTAVPAGAVHA